MSNIKLNGLIIGDAPDMYGLRSFIGRSCHSIFSSHEIICTVREKADALGIDLTVTNGDELPKRLSSLLAESCGNIKDTAESIAADFGRRLGLIIYILKTSDEKTRLANTRFPDEDWTPWRSFRTIIISGGLSGGMLGKKLCFYATTLLKELDVNDLTVIPGSFHSYDQLIGCAKINDSVCSRAVVFDFGHSFVKSGIVSYDGNKVTKLTPLERIPSRFMKRGYEDKEEEYRDAVGLHEFIVNTVSERYTKHWGDGLSDHIVISIANNVNDGKIIWGGCYYKLMFISPEYEKHLENSIRSALGKDVRVTLVHDGKAAALCYSGLHDCALIAIGTAFGVGYPEDIPGLKDTSEVKIEMC